MNRKILFGMILLAYAFACTVSVRHCLLKGFSVGVSAQNIESAVHSSMRGGRYLREIFGVCNLLLSPHELASNGGATVKDEDGFLDSFYVTNFDVARAGKKQT